MVTLEFLAESLSELAATVQQCDRTDDPWCPIESDLNRGILPCVQCAISMARDDTRRLLEELSEFLNRLNERCEQKRGALTAVDSRDLAAKIEEFIKRLRAASREYEREALEHRQKLLQSLATPESILQHIQSLRDDWLSWDESPEFYSPQHEINVLWDTILNLGCEVIPRPDLPRANPLADDRRPEVERDLKTQWKEFRRALDETQSAVNKFRTQSGAGVGRRNASRSAGIFLKADTDTKRPKGRPGTDPNADEQIADAWDTGRYKTYAELAREKSMTTLAVKRALDRHRKRHPTRRKK